MAYRNSTNDPVPATFETIFRCKGLVDDCKTLSEMAAALENAAKEIREMEADGVRLREAVADDYAFLVTTDATVAKKHGLEKPE